MSYAAPKNVEMNQAVRSESRSRMRGDFTVRPCRLDEVTRINAFYNDPSIRPDAAFSAPRTEAQWRWEYDPDRTGTPCYVLAESGGRIIGTQACIPIEFVADGRVVLTGKDEDTLVHPEFRGMGILDAMYERMVQLAEARGIELLWGFTGTAVRALERNGFSSLGPFDSWASTNWAAPACPASKGLEIRQWSDPDERCDAFSIEFGRHWGGFMPHLSARYLRWRLLDNPWYRHVLFAAFDGKKLVGLAACKLDHKNRIGCVSELAAISTELFTVTQVATALLREAMTLFETQRCKSLEARPAGTHAYNRRLAQLLESHGFTRRDPRMATTFLVRPLSTAAAGFADLGAWRLAEIMREY